MKTLILLMAIVCSVTALAGNTANPDAISLEPIPAPVEMKVDMDAPVAFDATTTVTLDCPDAAAATWLAEHLGAWYGAFGHAAAARSVSSKHSVLDFHPEYEPLFEPGGWNWCLTNPETQRVLRELIDEMLDVFGHPPFIHLGCDEAQPPTCPDCRKRPYGALVSEHIAGLAAFAKEHGARAMIWHDMLLKHGDPQWKGFVASGTTETAKLADTLPRDVIICDWQYSYGDMKETRKDWPTMKYFHDKGFDVLGCPWMNYNAMKPMADALAGFGGFGILETTWHHLGRRDWISMYRHGASAAWGTSSPKGWYGRTPQSDVVFDRALRFVGQDMKVKDYRDTGIVDWQIPPSWWFDNN